MAATCVDGEFVLSGGRTVAYAQYGVDDGVPVLFFQGTPSSRWMRPPDAITTELGVRLLVVDRPGFGRSDPAPGRTLVGWAEDVARVLDHLGIGPFRTVGVSGGGPYVLATAWRWPDRVRAASVCGGSGPLDLPGALRGAALVRRAGYNLARHAPGLLRFVIRHGTDARADDDRFVRRYTAHNPPSDQAIIAEPEFRAMYRVNFAEAYRQGPDAFADEVILASRDWGFDLRQIQVPVHFWHGALDNSTPLGMSRGMANRVPKSTLTIVPEQGHLLVYGPLWRDVLGALRDANA